LNKVKVLDRQAFDRGGPSHVQAFLNAVLFPSVRLLGVHPQQTRIRTLTVAVTHPGTNAHNCSLTSSTDHTTIYPLGHCYLSKSKWLDTYRYLESQLPWSGGKGLVEKVWCFPFLGMPLYIFYNKTTFCLILLYK
jgi:hypothetical protein